jgi:hypothetical protein
VRRGDGLSPDAQEREKEKQAAPGSHRRTLQRVRLTERAEWRVCVDTACLAGHAVSRGFGRLTHLFSGCGRLVREVHFVAAQDERCEAT